jgi:uncharacterized membrane protein YdbT with pleckstrin-like domain
MADIHLRPEGDERFIYIAHRHWAALLIRAIVPVIVFAIAAAALLIRALDRTPDFLGRQPPLFDPLNIALMISIVITVAILMYVYLDWRNDHIIVSNKRIVHEDRTLWLAYRYEIIPLDQVQNVNIRTDNFLQYVFKYGRVEIQAAGPTEPIVFDRANSPIQIQREILNEVQREKRSMEQKRLLATVERRLNPQAPPPPPLRVPIEDQVSQPNPLHLLFPITPIVRGGVITWHRHWIVLLKQLIGPLIAFGVWLLLLWAVPRFELLAPTPTVIVLFLGFVAVLLYAFWQYENWRNDIYILEPSKVIDIQRLPFGLYEDRREATLGVIQNVNAASPNLVARILGYGDVLIETAGAAGNFTFDHVPDPDQVQRIVFEYRERFRWEQREREWNNTLNIVEMYYRAGNNGNP